MKLDHVELSALTPEILRVFGQQTPLLTAGDRSGLNTMTIGWCQLGRLWSVPVCTVFVRPERYTYQFMESRDYFTVSVLPPELKKITAFCGSRSGRDVDKVKECGLTVRYGAGDAPFFRRGGVGPGVPEAVRPGHGPRRRAGRGDHPALLRGEGRLAPDVRGPGGGGLRPA